MRDDFFLRLRKLRYEYEKKREKVEGFIAECLGAQTPEQKQDEERTEHALMGVRDPRVSPRISAERAQRLYAVRLAATSLYERFEFGQDLSSVEVSLLLALGNELIGIEGKKGMIPAMEVLKKKKGEVPRAFSYLPGAIFTFPIESYLDSGNVGKDTVSDILTFSHRVYRWSTEYLRKHTDVGAIIQTKNMSSPSERVRAREEERQKKLRGPEANYIISWGAIPFRLYQSICASGALLKLPKLKQQEALSGILKELRHDIYYAEYYNPAFLESLPRRSGIQKTYEVLIDAVVLNPAVDKSFRQAVYDEIFDIATDSDLPVVFKRPEEDEAPKMHRDEEIQELMRSAAEGMDEVLLKKLGDYKAE